MADHMRTSLVCDAITMAAGARERATRGGISLGSGQSIPMPLS
jgi:hypothetical protein